MPIKPFRTDGCSMWPDGPYGGCCVDHDKVYWRGGRWRERLKADNDLFHCVKAHSRLGILMAAAMWIGVRFGGSPFLPTPWRWGYGHGFPKYRDQ